MLVGEGDKGKEGKEPVTRQREDDRNQSLIFSYCFAIALRYSKLAQLHSINPFQNRGND